MSELMDFFKNAKILTQCEYNIIRSKSNLVNTFKG